MIRVGTSGWNYPNGPGTWNGIFYPARRPTRFDELRYYAEHFDTVEVNSSFYRMPEPPQSRRWVERTPAGFLFAIKLFQKFTHPDMYLKRDGVKDWDVTRDDIDLFRAGIEPLVSADRLGALLIQFPPSFHAEPDTREYLDWLLEAFGQYPMAVELRHKSWSTEAQATIKQLSEHRAAWTLNDEPKFASSVSGRVPYAQATSHDATSALTYVRLHGRNAAQWWEHEHRDDRYDYLYSPEELAPFAKLANKAASTGRRVLMYLNNHFSAKAVANAAILKNQLGQPIPGEYTNEIVARYPELSGIVYRPGPASLM